MEQYVNNTFAIVVFTFKTGKRTIFYDTALRNNSLGSFEKTVFEKNSVIQISFNLLFSL